jgi:hypothetical protein
MRAGFQAFTWEKEHVSGVLAAYYSYTRLWNEVFGILLVLRFDHVVFYPAFTCLIDNSLEQRAQENVLQSFTLQTRASCYTFVIYTPNPKASLYKPLSPPAKTKNSSANPPFPHPSSHPSAPLGGGWRVERVGCWVLGGGGGREGLVEGLAMRTL